MKTGKKLHTLETITEGSGLKHSIVGDAKIFQNELEVTVEGSSAKLLGFVRYIRRKNLSFSLKKLVQDR
ncbi:hypothetical protein [Flavobacterium sp. 3HN19-14]|uniref:hypothetical protein n=1 Tax=Flavobacterium sp. 3HN19-14 TaxID=3448133 RepID=UPI003EE26E45